MKKVIMILAGLITLAACNKKDNTANEGMDAAVVAEHDGVAVNADTVAPATTDMPVAENNLTADKDIKVAEPKEVAVAYASFGDKIMADKALTKEQMLQKYKTLKAGDTINVKFKSKIKEVCSKKGCWMSLELPSGKESFVKFKDYAFFVPLNAAEKEAIVSGKAFVSETSVDALRHYAKDGGKSEAEIAKITEPKIEYKFMADGVLISK